MVAKKHSARVAKWSVLLALGPTAILCEGVYRNLRGGAPILAGLYAVALVEIWVLMVFGPAQLVRLAS